MATHLVEAQSMQVGDKVAFKRTVISVVKNGITIPSGKCEIVLQQGDNPENLQKVYWGKRTKIRGTREE
jgi:hypothetical protein